MSSIALSGVPELHAAPPTLSPGLRRVAIVAAALLHFGVFLWLFHPWRHAQEHKSPDVVPVSLVFEPPPKPKPPPAPAAAPAPPIPGYRESGPDDRTTAPPPPDDTKTEDKPPEPAPPEPAPPTPEIALIVPPPSPGQGSVPDVAPPKPKAEPPRPTAAPKEKPTRPPAPSHAEPRPPTRMKNAAPDERQQSGDPYFNAAARELEKHRFYPPLARPLGLVGTAGFTILIDRTGKILDLRLENSSGSEIIDRAAEKIIRDTARFPPPPPDLPGEIIRIWLELPIRPD